MIISRAAVASRHNFRSFDLRFRLVLMLAGCVTATAITVNAQTSSARPVARLVTASPQALPTRARRVTVLRSAFASHAPSSTGAIGSTSATSMERRAFELINAQRNANGEEPLAWDEELCRMARQHSENMARQNFFSHVGRDGRDTRDRARALNIRDWKAVGENIAYNQGFDDPVAFAVERWMLSATHRSNILNAMYTRSGLGIARAADGTIFFTQVFIMR
jgi:uncharacterized protein YkwD